MSDVGKQTEPRHQRALSSVVVAGFSFFILAGGAVLLFFLLHFIPGRAVEKQATSLERELEMLAPQVSALQTALDTIAANRRMLDAIDRWSGGDRPPMYRVLRSIQEQIPAQMKLYHLSAALKGREGEDAPAGTVRISGTAMGEETILDARQRLNRDAELHRFCGEMRLINSRRYLGESWSFAFHGGLPVEGQADE